MKHSLHRAPSPRLIAIPRRVRRGLNYSSRELIFSGSYPEILRQWPRFLLGETAISSSLADKGTPSDRHTTATIAFVLSVLYIIPGIAGMLLSRARGDIVTAFGAHCITLIYLPTRLNPDNPPVRRY